MGSDFQILTMHTINIAGVGLLGNYKLAMLKRTRNLEPADESNKGRKRAHEDEETTVEENVDPGRLGNFIKNPRMIELLQKNGVKCLFPIQYSTFNLIVKGNDIRAKDRTGSGKTLAFALPVIEKLRNEKRIGGKNPGFLVVLPTRELVLQVAANIEKLRLNEDEFKVAAVYGGQQMALQIAKLKRGVDVIVATPGRLIDLTNKGNINFQSLKVICLDEADEMLKQGFQEDVQRIFGLIKEKTSKVQTLLFSATWPSWVNELSQKYQTANCPMIDMVKEDTISIPKTITHYLYSGITNCDRGALIKKLRAKFTSKNGRCIVFCETKREVNDLKDSLEGNSAILHGDVPQRDRENVYREFKSGKITTVVATNVAARGLDFPDIELVIQVEPPKQLESYIHRAGRTGRAGKKGVCVLLGDPRKRHLPENIERDAKIKFETLGDRDLK